MSEPSFTRRELTLTFTEDAYLAQLTENTALLAETLQLGQDEAGMLDKKLRPDLVHLVSRVIEGLHHAEYRAEAERKLATLNEPDVAVAILRQAFRVRNKRVAKTLSQKLLELCQTDIRSVAREAVREAAGSELQRLSQLADTVFLKIANTDELQMVASDTSRVLDVRIQACQRLLEQRRRPEAVPLALEMFVVGCKQSTVKERLRQLSHSFAALLALEPDVLQAQVVAPVLDYLRQYDRNTEVRQYILWVVGALAEPVLTHLQEYTPAQVHRSDMWLALAVRQCAFTSVAATQLMLDWLEDEEVDERFRLELARRLKNGKIKFPPGMVGSLTAIIEDMGNVSSRLASEMRDALEKAIDTVNGQPQEPAKLYASCLQQYRVHRDDAADNDALWQLRLGPGGLQYLRSRLREMDEEELGLCLLILGHDRYQGRWSERLAIVMEAYPRLSDALQGRALQLLYTLAQNEPPHSPAWKQANDFLVALIDAGGTDSELARQYWVKLGEV